MRILLGLLILALSGAAPPLAEPASPVQSLTLEPCPGGRAGARAECGRLLVPENRTTGEGRRIPINVVVLRAETPGARTALFLLAGGPGQGSTAMAGTANGWMAPLRASTDMVLMDQRGTGGSNALSCDTDIATDPASAFGHIRDPAVIRACRAALEPRADLTQYTTDAAVADMEELRARLGYDSIALYGGSYGTRIAQEYLRRHPDRTRAVVIDGVLPFDVGGPLSYARSLDGSIDRVLARCRAVPACQQANPDLASDLAAVLTRLDRTPATATVRPTAGAPVTVTMTRGDFLYAIRGMLYNAGAPDELPAMITKAAATGDLSAFAQRYWSRAVSMGRSIAYGMHLSVLCPEDVDGLTDAQIAAATGLHHQLVPRGLRALAQGPRGFRLPHAGDGARAGAARVGPVRSGHAAGIRRPDCEVPPARAARRGPGERPRIGLPVRARRRPARAGQGHVRRPAGRVPVSLA
jgi:pimeloyl-ACP methyl ester carboxylesterase